MRILLLVDWFPVLSETHILNRIIGLLDRGHDVEILANGPGENSIVQHGVTENRLLERLSYYRLPTNRFSKLARMAAILLGQPPNFRMWQAAWDVVRRAGPRRGEVFYSADALSRRSCDYDIIQCEFGPIGLTALRLRELGFVRGKIVTSFRGYDITSYIQSRPNYYSQLFSQGDHFLPVCEAFKHKLVELGCPETKITVQPAAVDWGKIVAKEPSTDRHRAIRIVSVGRLVEQKGFEYGIRAISTLIGKGFDVTYDIVGDGPLLSDLQRLIFEQSVAARIKLLGWRGQLDVFRIISEADILLAPSVTARNGDQEGIPNVLIESMASATPVVSTRHSGIPELVSDGVNGLLVPERNSDALATAVQRLVEDSQLRSRFGEAGRQLILTSRALDALNDRLVRIYECLMAGGDNFPSE